MTLSEEFNIVTSILVVAGLVILLRQFERWLHQHIFKVGWLLTQNYQTTTILYYTFFLPGILIHEIVYWLTAGILNVRADRAIQWPEKQEIGELHLKFVRISNRASPIRKAIITVAPLAVGVLIIWYVANNQFNINAVFNQMSSGRIDDVTRAIQSLTQTTDFWLWFYFIFTVSNTMFPSTTKDLRGWWIILGAILFVFFILFIIGIGNQLFSLITPPLLDILGSLSAILLVMIGMNLFMTMILGLIEAIVERATGHSATFKNGKMLTMTRAELKLFQQQERQRAQVSKKQPQTERGAPSIYHLPLPIPAGPGTEPVLETPTAILGIDSGKQPASPPLKAGNISLDSDEQPPTRHEPLIRLPITEERSDDDNDDDEISSEEAPPSTKSLATPRPSFTAPIKSDESTKADVSSPFAPFNTSKPPSSPEATTPKSEDSLVDEADETSEEPPSPFTRRPTGILNRPAAPPLKKDITTSGPPSQTSSSNPFSRPATPPAGGFPTKPTFGETFNKPSSPSPTTPSEESDEARRTPNVRPFSPRPQGLPVSPISSGPSSRPPSPTNDGEDADAEEDAPSSTFSGPTKRLPLSPIPRASRDLRAELNDEEDEAIDYEDEED